MLGWVEEGEGRGAYLGFITIGSITVSLPFKHDEKTAD